jgi:hypothetical protein
MLEEKKLMLRFEISKTEGGYLPVLDFLAYFSAYVFATKLARKARGS